MSASEFEIRFAEEIEGEVKEIFDWYMLQSPRTSIAFIEALDALLLFLTTNPYTFSKQRKNFRVAYVKKFPYAIMYEIAGKVILTSPHSSGEPCASKHTTPKGSLVMLRM